MKAKSLIRVTRNADIDADALYDEDLDYREFMVEVIKKRKRLAPVRLELSRELDGDIVDTLCDYLGVNKKHVFRGECPLDLSFVFQIQDMLRNIPELFYEKRVPQKSAQFQSEMPILQQIEGNLIYPHVVGNSVGLPSIWVLVAVTVGGNLMGVVGMLVFIPLTSVLYALLRQTVHKRLKERKIHDI